MSVKPPAHQQLGPVFGDPRRFGLAPVHDLNLPSVCIDVACGTHFQYARLPFLARNEQDALAALHHLGSGSTGTGLAGTYLGTAMPHIREAYYAALEKAQMEIAARQRMLGARLNDPAVQREFVRWASQKRTDIARVFRIPMGPGAMLGGEVRDWHKYGPGGRSFDNLYRRQMARPGMTDEQALMRILNSVDKPNAQVTLQAARTARILRGGGVVMVVGGIALSGYEIYQATPQQRPELIKRTAATTAASTAGSALAIGFAVMLGATGVGLIAIGIVAGIAASYATEEVFFTHDEAQVQALQRHGFVDGSALHRMNPR